MDSLVKVEIDGARSRPGIRGTLMDSAYSPFLLAVGIALIGFLVWYMRSWMSSSASNQDQAQEFSIDLLFSNGHAVLKAAGNLEMSGSSLLRKEIEGLIARDQKRIVLDLSGAFLDDAAIGELVSNYSRVRSMGGEMAIVRGEANEVLEEISMGDLAPSLHDSLEEAMRHLNLIFADPSGAAG
jgi:anti-anti-sigma factor